MRKLKKPSTLRISACLIVKNEELHLVECLQTLLGFVSEIVVVDTGSVDNTLTIARQFTSKVFTFPWDDDFSAPRNFAVKQATGDWILHVDADERWSPQAFNILFQTLAAQKLNEPIVIHCNYASANEILLKRTLHRRGFFDFKGCVHEYLCSPLPEKRIDLPDVHIQHLSIPNAQKHRYYEQLILKSLASESPSNGRKMELYWHLYLSRQIWGGDTQEALQYAFAYLQEKGLEHTHFDYVLLMTALFSQEPSSELLSLVHVLTDACRLFNTAACWFFRANLILYQKPNIHRIQGLAYCLQRIKQTYDPSEVFKPELSDCALLWSRYCVQEARFSEALLHARKAYAMQANCYTQSYLAFLLVEQEGKDAMIKWLSAQNTHESKQKKLWRELCNKKFFNQNEKKMLKSKF